MPVSLTRDRITASAISTTEGPDYTDLAVYVRDTGATPYREYKFPVSLDKETGAIFDGDVQVSTGPHSVFDECGEEPPEAILAAFARVRPQMVQQLEAKRTTDAIDTKSPLANAIRNIVASSDANDGDALAEAIRSARDLIGE